MERDLRDVVMHAAARRLSSFIVDQARLFARFHGIGWVEADEGVPETLEQMQAAFHRACQQRIPYPVWKGGSERTIYASQEVNWAFRFLHDMHHVLYQYDVGFVDEVRLTLETARNVFIPEFGLDSPEVRLYLLDTYGQQVYKAFAGEFPPDQYSTVRKMYRDGHDNAMILQELENICALSE